MKTYIDEIITIVIDDDNPIFYCGKISYQDSDWISISPLNEDEREEILELNINVKNNTQILVANITDIPIKNIRRIYNHVRNKS